MKGVFKQDREHFESMIDHKLQRKKKLRNHKMSSSQEILNVLEFLAELEAPHLNFTKSNLVQREQLEVDTELAKQFCYA